MTDGHVAAGVRNAGGTRAPQAVDVGAVSYGSFLVRAWERGGSLRVVIEAVQSGRRTELRDGPARILLDVLRGDPAEDRPMRPEPPADAEDGTSRGRRSGPVGERQEARDG